MDKKKLQKKVKERMSFITPSRFYDDDEEEVGSNYSENYSKNNVSENAAEATKYGNMIHLLLQKLPELEADKRRITAEKLLDSIEEKQILANKEKIIEEALSVINFPDFKFIFELKGYNEFPVCGIYENSFISAQIDRIVIDEQKNEVIIIDYKSNKEPPESLKKIPKKYIEQMKAYKFLVKRIFPDKEVKSALLWTKNLQLDYI